MVIPSSFVIRHSSFQSCLTSRFIRPRSSIPRRSSARARSSALIASSRPGVSLGENCWLQHHVTLDGPLRAGRGQQILRLLLDRPANPGPEISRRADLSRDRRRQLLPRVRHDQSQHIGEPAKRASAAAEISSPTRTSGTIARSATRSFFPTTARSPDTCRWAITRSSAG